MHRGKKEKNLGSISAIWVTSESVIVCFVSNVSRSTLPNISWKFICSLSRNRTNKRKEHRSLKKADKPQSLK